MSDTALNPAGFRPAPSSLWTAYDRRSERMLTAAMCVVVAVSIIGCSPPPLPSSAHPIIIIDIDTLRADHVGCYGYSRNTSPNIDAFAEEAVVFDWAFSQAPNTPPSQSSILTGLYPGTHGMVLDEDRLPESAVTIAEAMRNAGFATVAHHDGGYMSDAFNMGQGFDVYQSHEFKGLGSIGPQVFEWLTENHDKNFLLLVHTYDTHSPYSAGEPYDSIFTHGLAPPSPGFEPTSEALDKVRSSQWSDNPIRLADNDLEYARALYDGGIRRVDDWFGELWSLILSLGLDEQATIVLLSDHGEEFQEHGSVLHEKLYATVTHVPMIIRLPGATHSGRHSTVVELVDVMPTLLELTGIPVPDQVQGESLTPLMSGKMGPHPSIAFGESPFFGGRRHVTTDEYRMIFTHTKKAPELYLYREDPSEQNDIAKHDEDVVAKLVEALRDWEANVRQPLSRSTEEPQELDQKTLQQLRELGYIE